MDRKAYTTRLLWPLLILLTGATGLGAITNEWIAADYSPSLNGRSWPRFPVVAYVERASNVWVHPSEPQRFPTVTETHDPDSDFTTVVIKLSDGRRFKTYNDFVLGPYLSAVYSGDLNNDGQLDFVAVKPGSGCGLAAEYCTGVFAFSDDNDYRFTRISTMGLGPHHLVIDPKTNTFRLIHAAFRQGESTDGRTHSYWVHRFYKWDNLRFERDENLPPIWIQYLNRPNHEPTNLLTPRRKAKAWAGDSDADAKIDW
ncbi:MAG TPA: hypothetical protein P5205_18065 [Candidatus Paceibacterota bacterium]|nr:hypothetical protein [Verrucomicrobiota bacterium]HSA12269.1 hypothetical protein [Candidatus Paceibacterota bacterium]